MTPVHLQRQTCRNWQRLVSDEVLQQPRTLEVFEKIYGDPNLEFHLPAKKALPGAVLKHIYKFVEDLVAREYPLVYKLGFTHDAQWRFRNPKYGYCHDKFHKWEKMYILYMGAESIAAAYIEAAAIQKFKGDLVEKNTPKSFSPGFSSNLCADFILVNIMVIYFWRMHF